MDFTHSPEQHDAAELAATILGDACTPEALKAIDAQPERFDRALWARLGAAGLLGLPLPESHGGAGLGLLELCSVLVEVGRVLAPAPVGAHAVSAMALAEFGTGAWADQVAAAASGGIVATVALSEEGDALPTEPRTRAEAHGDHWQVTGCKTVVTAGTVADLFLVPAQTTDGPTMLVVLPDDPGVTVLPQQLSDGDRAARVVLERAVVPIERTLGGVGHGAEVTAWIADRLVVAVCAQQLGTLEGALRLTAAYARTREQFGRPIGTFQAVGQRLADGYIDTLGARLTLWQAAWRLSEGEPAAAEIATAKLWAADAGHALAHTTVHVHGGVGIDLDGEAHRYFTAAKRLEFSLGSATEQARTIGRLLAGPSR